MGNRSWRSPVFLIWTADESQRAEEPQSREVHGGELGQNPCLLPSCGRLPIGLVELQTSCFKQTEGDRRQEPIVCPTSNSHCSVRLGREMLERLKHILLFKYIRLFDGAFYLEKYPDLAAAGVNPLRHYLRYGAAEHRKPHPLFDPDYYLRRNPQARGSGNPLVHFLEKGGASGMSPHPLFDCEAYFQAHPDAAAAGMNPLAHHVVLQNRNRAQGIPVATEGSQFGCAS
jgi:hypothetical protein